MESWNDVWWKLVEGMVPIVVGVITLLVIYATRWLAARTSSTRLASFLTLIGNVVNTAVLDIEQTMVAGLKKGREDGKLTDEEKVDVLNACIDRARKLLGEQGVALAQSAAGMGRDELDAYLKSHIEAEVNRMPDR
jgi:predicted anti-sigma-YlaC factor YlaD